MASLRGSLDMNKINPPPRLQTPQQFLSDPISRAYFRQTETILFQLWNKTGGNSDPISDLKNQSSSGFSSQVQWLQKQINGLPEFTMDTEGFTMDSTEFTMDKVIA